MDLSNMRYVIFAPHMDDEIIGCFELLFSERVDKIYWLGAPHDIKTRDKLEKEFCCKAGHLGDFHSEDFISIWKKDVMVFVPDPFYELHPAHKAVGHAALRVYHEERIPIGLYSTNMNAPYIRELGTQMANNKKHALDLFYGDKADLWLYDHRYFLFEGRTVLWHD